MNYYDLYKKRLNKYGDDYQSRIQGKREREFQDYLRRSVYRVSFTTYPITDGNDIFIGSFEKYKQDETETLHYLLVAVDVQFAPGSILMIPNKDGVEMPWMVYYLENIHASGYNRYIMLRMTHFLAWIARDGNQHESWAYMYGQEDNMLKDELRSRSRMDTLYTENLKLNFFVLPRNQYIKKDDYFIIGEQPFQEYYRVTGYDIQSSPGVEYVSIDPIYEYDLTPAPEQGPTDPDDEFYWLNNRKANTFTLYDASSALLEDRRGSMLVVRRDEE